MLGSGRRFGHDRRIHRAPVGVSTGVKTIGWILATLLVLVLLLLPLVASRAQRWPDCKGDVVMVRGIHGEPLECVCVGGTLSTCFSPGP